MSESCASLLKSWIAEHYRIDVLETSVGPKREDQDLKYEATVGVVGLTSHRATESSEWCAVEAASRSLYSTLVSARNANPGYPLSRQSKNYLAISEPGLGITQEVFERWEKALSKRITEGTRWVVLVARSCAKYRRVTIFWRGHPIVEFLGQEPEVLPALFDYFPLGFLVDPAKAEEVLYSELIPEEENQSALLEEQVDCRIPMAEMIGRKRKSRYVSHLRRVRKKSRVSPEALAKSLPTSLLNISPQRRLEASGYERRQDACKRILFACRTNESLEVIVARGCGSSMLVDDLLQKEVIAEHTPFFATDLDGVDNPNAVLVRNLEDVARYVRDHDGAIFCHQMETTHVATLTLATMFLQRDGVVIKY